jgi:hypothetical protein
LLINGIILRRTERALDKSGIAVAPPQRPRPATSTIVPAPARVPSTRNRKITSPNNTDDDRQQGSENDSSSEEQGYTDDDDDDESDSDSDQGDSDEGDSNEGDSDEGESDSDEEDVYRNKEEREGGKSARAASGEVTLTILMKI